LFVVCISAGSVAAILVYAGDTFRWPHFHRRAGYFGTELIGDILYVINDPSAIHIVAFLWFSYAAGFVGILSYFMRKLLRERFFVKARERFDKSVFPRTRCSC
jgi:hypothetical protein